MGQFMAFILSMAFYNPVADRKKVGGVVRCFRKIMIVKRSPHLFISKRACSDTQLFMSQYGVEPCSIDSTTAILAFLASTSSRLQLTYGRQFPIDGFNGLTR